jgi:hypothetical protein
MDRSCLVGAQYMSAAVLEGTFININSLTQQAYSTAVPYYVYAACCCAVTRSTLSYSRSPLQLGILPLFINRSLHMYHHVNKKRHQQNTISNNDISEHDIACILHLKNWTWLTLFQLYFAAGQIQNDNFFPIQPVWHH